MMAKNIKTVGVLVAICTVVALLLALTNQITAPVIKKNEQIKAAAALREVMPEGTTFEKMDLSGYTLPDTVTEVQKETEGKGYVIKLTTKGYGTDMVIMCGVTTDGTVTGAQCLSSNETLGHEKTYGKNFAGKDAAGVEAVDTIGGATMTTSAYKAAIKDAVNTVSILKGEVVDLRSEEEKAVDAMIAELEATEAVDLSQYQLPSSITKALKGSKGYVIYLTVTGYQPGMEIVCGVSADNKVVNAVCLKSNETMAKEKDYGNNFVDKDAAGVEAVDTIAGSTMTTTAYKNAVKDALQTALVLGGANIDLRDPAQILQDNLAAALPAGEGKFTKLFLTETGENVSAVYAADNGAGHVVIIGEEFVAVDAEGNSDNAVAAAVVAANKADSTDITASFTETLTTLIANTTDRKALATYKGLQSNVLTVKKTASGNYIIDIQGAGYGINGGDAYHPASGKPIVIRVSMSPAGKIIDCLTVSQEETDGLGSVCGDEDFSSRFDGKTESEIADVDGIAGATLTTDGYKKAVERCFAAVTILEGGAK